MAETFGKTDKGGTLLINSYDKIEYCKFQSGSAGTLASISPFLYRSGGTSKVKCKIYDSSKNQITNGETEEKVVGVVDAFVDFNFPTAPSVAASTDYYLCLWNDTITAIYGDAGGTNQYGRDEEIYDGWPASLATDYEGNWEMSIYATYEEAAVAKTLIQAALISAVPLIVIPTLHEIAKFTGGRV